MLTVSLIIPVWNSLPHLKKNLQKTLNICHKEGVKEFILIDDASTDTGVDFIKKLSPTPPITLIEKDKNSGFASTVNLGARSASSDILFLLNTDAVPQAGFLKLALHHFKDEQVFSVSLNDDGAPATGYFQKGFLWHRPLSPEALAKGDQLTANSQQLKTMPTLWSLAGNGLYRKSTWDALDGLDEIYDPFYWEDIDIGYRALKRGWLNLWEPKSLVTHSSTKGVIKTHFPQKLRDFYSRRNHFLFMWKNIHDPKLITSHLAWLPYHLLRHPSYIKPFLAALSQSPKVLRNRLHECREKVLSDPQVLNIFK
jgi:GT2 family glycosyltransferase